MGQARAKNMATNIKVDDINLDALAFRIEHIGELTNARLDRILIILEEIEAKL